MKTLKRLEELPSWFNIENYNKLSQLSSKEWYLELKYRNYYYSAPFTSQLVNVDREVFFSRGHGEKIAPQKEAPESVTKFEDVSIFENGELIFISPISKGSYFKTLEFDRGKDWMPVRDLTGKMSMRELEEMTSVSKNRILVADISAPDDVLEMNFKAWLKSIRKKLAADPLTDCAFPANNKSKIPLLAETKFRFWVDCGLLPYCDLYQWSLLTGVKITKTLFGEAVFPGSNGGNKAQRIKDTTVKNAQNVYWDLHTLSSQVFGSWKVK